jgi:hypothetical protein
MLAWLNETVTSSRNDMMTEPVASDSAYTVCYKGRSEDRYQEVSVLIDLLDTGASSDSSPCSSSMSLSSSSSTAGQDEFEARHLLGTSSPPSSPPSWHEDEDFACSAADVAEARGMWLPAQHEYQASASCTTGRLDDRHPWRYAPQHDEPQHDQKLAALVGALNPQDFSAPQDFSLVLEELRLSLIAAGLQQRH